MQKPTHPQQSEPEIQNKWLPVLVGTLLCILVIFLWWTLKNREHLNHHKKIEAQATKLAAYIEADMRSRIPALQRLVDRWEIRGGTPKHEFLSDTQSYINDLPGFQAIEWIDKSYFVRWIVPFAGNEKALNLNLASEEQRRIALEKAKLRNSPTMTGPIELVQGGKGFLIYFPIFNDSEFDGFVLAVFRIQEWFNYVFSVRESNIQRKYYNVMVKIDNTPVFRQPGWESNNGTDLESIVNTKILNHNFSVQCRPTLSFKEENRSALNELVAVIGLFMSVLVSFIVHLFQRASTEAWKTHAAKTSLESAILENKKTKDELEDTYTRLNLATNAGNIGIWVWDIATDKLTWNSIMYDLYEVSPDVIPTYETWRSAVHEEDISNAEARLQSAVTGKAQFNTEFRICLTGDIVRNIRAAARVERDHEGEPVRMTGVNWDITELKRAEGLLSAERRRLSYILEGTNVGTWEWNIQTGETVFNERWANIIGYTLDELSPVSINTWIKFTHPDDLKKSNELIEKHFRGELEFYEFEARMRHKNGNWVWVYDRGKIASWSKEGKPLLMSGTHQEITERKKAEEKIRHLATHDALTNLPSLRLAKDRISMAISMAHRSKKSVAVLFIDLDGFKAVNDTYGHDTGDELLKEVAERLLSSIRDTDTAARIGGDEFLVILTELSNTNFVEKIAVKIIDIISEPFNIGEHQAVIGTSIGISLYPDYGKDVESLIKKADEAMYKVKKSGKNDYTFADDL